MIPSPTEIIYFLEVYQQKHLSKAAMRLGISQPTLTQALQRLEEKLGVSLFHRTKQGMVPNKNATVFFSHAKSLKDCWGEIENSIGSAANDIEGKFTVGCHLSVAVYTIPTLLKNLNEHAPLITINLIHDFSRKITSAVSSFEIDIGYVVNPPRHPDLVLKKLGDDEVTFWKKAGAKNIPNLIFADGNREQVEQLLGKTYSKHFKGWQVVESTSFEVIRTLTAEGLGIGIIPARVAMPTSTGLVHYDSSLPKRHDEIFLTYRKDVLNSKAGKELVKHASFNLN